MDSVIDTQNLIANMHPELHDDEYVLCTVDRDSSVPLELEPLGWFRELEGVSLILSRISAENAGLNYGPVFRLISLQVYSSLQAVGFIAEVASKLASADVSVNMISAYHHDHILVPREKVSIALTILTNMMSDAAQSLITKETNPCATTLRVVQT